MTVVYTHEVATGSKGFGNFFKLLFRWKGSIYKLVVLDLLLYAFFFYVINVTYRCWLSEQPEDFYYRIKFHQLVDYCDEWSGTIPLQFVLGFYISQVVTRWWSQFMAIPWPDTVAIIVATSIQGHDERGRLMRRTILRYVNLCLIFTFCTISPQARKRFPTMDHMVAAGFLLPHEKIIIDHLNEKLDGPKYYVPIVWAGSIGAKARKEGRIRDDVAIYHLVKALCKFRLMAGDLLSYDWISIPLVYTQVVTLACYIYFLACVFGKQLLRRDDKIDLYVPVFHFLEFFFMMGWLKVAETLINPFGEDDDDFEVNWLIDRDIMVSYMIVDVMNNEFPELVKDQYWDSIVPEELYYTENALKYKTEGYAGSAAAAEQEEKGEKKGGHDNESKKGDGSIIHLPHAGGSHAHKDATESVAHLFDHSFTPKYTDSIEDMAKAKAGTAPASAPATGRKSN